MNMRKLKVLRLFIKERGRVSSSMTVHKYKNWGDNFFFSNIQLFWSFWLWLCWYASFSYQESEAQLAWCTYLERLGWLSLRKDSDFPREVILDLTKLLVQPLRSNQLPIKLRKFVLIWSEPILMSTLWSPLNLLPNKQVDLQLSQDVGHV